MRVVPERSAWLQIVTVFVAFLVGPWAALQAGLRLTPGSDLVQTIGPFAFMLVFVGGTLLWMGIGVTVVVVRGLWSLIRGRLPGPKSLTSSDVVVPPGYRAFPVLGLGAGLAVGLLAGAVTDLALLTASGAWTALGGSYGALLWTVAHHGYLPFPEPE